MGVSIDGEFLDIQRAISERQHNFPLETIGRRQPRHDRRRTEKYSISLIQIMLYDYDDIAGCVG